MDACGASSPPPPLSTPKKYDVFLSFRGEDTRDKFTSHLYAALNRKKIKTYIDDVSLERGDEISPALLEAIRKSKISVIVFSKNYASSSWCLSELLHILECHRENKQIVIPIFYEVDPSHIRKQEGSYEEAFLKHEKRFKDKMEIVQKWRDALTESANLSGYNSQVTRPDSKLVEEVVDDVLTKLSRTVPLDNSDAFEGLIGMKERFQQVELLLSIDSTDIRIIGLWGMGGIGKTTLAKAVYSQVFFRFESCCFLENVREASERRGGLEKLREELFAELLREKKVDLKTPYLLDNVKRRLKDTRVLIVLDDVSESEQLEHLVGEGKLFGWGSRILVTTRNQDVLSKIELADGIENCIYEVEQLNCIDAFELFNLTAFKKGMPATSDYTELSQKMVNYAGGNPLAIKILGSHLRSLGSPSKKKWEWTLKKFKDSPHDEIQKVLRISYDGLGESEKNVFLDIACFFKTEHKDFVEKILDGCGFFASLGIDILIDRSLVTVRPSSSELQMHGLVQEMGREIIRQESENKGERSRLWKADDINDVLENNEGTEKIQGIFLDLSEIDEDMHLEPSIFRRMNNLRLLKIYNSSNVKKGKVHLQGLEHLPRSLRYLEWHDYPLKSLPRKFKPKNLTVLKMPNSQLEQLGVQDLKNLKDIDLGHSSHLTQVLDLFGAPNLERINLEYCTSLLQVPSHILENLNRLIDLDMSYCNKLQSVPERIFVMASLTHLTLQGLSNLNTLPMSITTGLVSLNLDSTGIISMPSAIFDSLNHLSKLSLAKCRRLTNLPDLPLNIEFLDISGTAVKEVLSSSVEGRSHLWNVNMGNCKSLKHLPASIFKLRSLWTLNLTDCPNLKYLPEIPEPMARLCLLHLSRSGIRELPSSIGHQYDLKYVNLSYSDITEIPANIKELSKLRKLLLKRCKYLRSLPELPLCLERLDASGCTSLEVVSNSKRAFTQEFWDYVGARTTESAGSSLFCDCLKLDEDQRHDIFIEFQLRALRTAIRFVRKEIRSMDYTVSLCLPGSVILKWFRFDHRSKGSFLKIKLSPQRHNSNFLGFVLCAVGSSYSYTERLVLYCEINLKHKQGCERIYVSCYGQLPTESNSSNVFVWYHCWVQFERIRAFDVEEASFIFFFEERNSNNESDGTKYSTKCKIMKCGAHMLNLQDLEEFGIEFMNVQHLLEDSDAIPDKPESSARETIDFATDEPRP